MNDSGGGGVLSLVSIEFPLIIIIIVLLKVYLPMGHRGARGF